METAHVSVLKDEAIDLLHVRQDKIYVDCTLGAGGHSAEILEQLAGTGHLFGFDQDEIARSIAGPRLRKINDNFTIISENFSQLQKAMLQQGLTKVDGILFDIGVSSMQLDQEERGFSYRFDAPLDMRMDRNQTLSAYDVVNTYTHQQLTSIFYRYGEEKFASKIATKIIQKRGEKPIETTFELIEVIRLAIPMKVQREKHPAKKVFQAIRIEVNDEIHVFETALEQAIEMLNIGGRLVVITFHSLEDRICKNIFNKYGKRNGPQNDLEKLIIKEEKLPITILTKKPIIATSLELENNPRAKSAKLRAIEKNI